MLRDSWRIMRRTPALLGLGTISALQGGMYAFVIAGLIVPMTALAQLLVTVGSSSTTAAGAPSALVSALPNVVSAIQRWEPAILGGIIAVVIVWAVLGIFDVAATGGLITQTDRVLNARDVSVGTGMRDGFAVWWRTIGLLAVAALPTLAYLLVVATFTLFTISIPLGLGLTPDLSAIRAGDAFNGVLSTLVGLVGIPLTVLVNLGLRYAVLDDQHWKVAFGSAWRLARSNLTDVALMYLLQLGVGFGAGVALSIVLGVLLVVAGIVVSLLVAAAHTFSGAAMFVTLLAGFVGTAVLLAYSVIVIAWFSVIWTLFWRRTTGRDPIGASSTERRVADLGEGPAGVGAVGVAQPWEAR